jgi:chemosensory pili system protein ChpC
MSFFFLDQKPPVAQLDCLAVSTGQSNLLVPMPAVAEIILNQLPIEDESSPEWMLGWISWRNLTIPLIDFSALQGAGSCKDFADSMHMIVLNSLVEGHQHRYYAIVCKGFPHTLRVAEDSALSAENSGANNGAQNTQQKPLCISFCFSLDGQILQLPDFEEIETYLCEIPNNC